MKKFLLSIFVIGAITLAQLPSILGCGHGAGDPNLNFLGSLSTHAHGGTLYKGTGKRSVGSKGN